MQPLSNLDHAITQAEGVLLKHSTPAEVLLYLRTTGISEGLSVKRVCGKTHCQMQDSWLKDFAPQANTLNLHQHTDNLKQEILWSMLVSPYGFDFEHLEALASAVRVRENIVLAARKTALAFKTDAAERPEAFWHYEEDAGFILQPGTCLIDALISATQPEATGKLYDFSCYRASEYVILLGLAQEAQQHHPQLLSSLQQLNEVHAVRSGQFHDVFLHEYGSLENPLPTHFFVPGDRLWFRNPHEPSSDVTGYEGSWVIYLGGGLFSNFWKRDQPFTLVDKCVEIYHWRDGLRTRENGECWIDESIVEECVKATHRQPEKLKQVLELMMRIRDGKGIYAEGGCLDATRECPKQIAFSACELKLPDIKPH
jgi:hypothetical protein